MLERPNILVIGGSGGIGLATVKEILCRHPSAKVTATWHSNQPDFQTTGLCWREFDVTNEANYEELSTELTTLDWIINTTGFLHNPDKGPEKTIKQFDSAFFMQNLTLNTLPTLLIAKHLGQSLKTSEQGVFASISARVGSISDNHLGGWLSYRSSKAALNMVLKTLSIEWRRQMKNVCVVALHPGTTDTKLSKPFQANVPTNKLFYPEKTARYLFTVIANLTPENTGTFIGWDGNAIPW